MTAVGWPATLVDGAVRLRPLRRRDQDAWMELRQVNAGWLERWDATSPIPLTGPRPSFGAFVRTLASQARAGTTLPFAVDLSGELVGQLTVSSITYGSLRSAAIGYWVSEHVAGVVGAPIATRTRPRPELHVSSARATNVARRFAAAWRAWDSGGDTPHDAAVLQRVSVAALRQRLRRDRARPTAGLPPKSLALHSVHAVACGHGTWRAALIARKPGNSYFGTVLLIATQTGPRVADVEH